MNINGIKAYKKCDGGNKWCSTRISIRKRGKRGIFRVLSTIKP